MITVLEQTDSTNLEAKRRVSLGAAHGDLIVARLQTEGRGRLGRRWTSDDGGLYMTLILFPRTPPALWPRLTTAVALAAARTLRERTGLDCLIKWPNDIVLHGKKLVGILLESGRQADLSYVVAGVGVNVGQSSFPPELASKATSLFLEGVSAHPLPLAADFACRALPLCDAITGSAFDALLADYTSLSATLGRSVVAHTPDGNLRGVAHSLARDGSLILQLPDGSNRALASGEVSVRGLLGYAE